MVHYSQKENPAGFMLSKNQNLQKRMYKTGYREHPEVFAVLSAVALVTALCLCASSISRLLGLQTPGHSRVPLQHGPHLQKEDTSGQEGQF